MLSLALSLYDFPILSDYQATNSRQSVIRTSCYRFYNDSFLFGSTEEQATISAYLYSNVTSIVQNGVRGIPLGQTAGQKTD